MAVGGLEPQPSTIVHHVQNPLVLFVSLIFCYRVKIEERQWGYAPYYKGNVTEDK